MTYTAGGLVARGHVIPFSPPITGILDQGQGVLIVFEDSGVDQTYTSALETISSTGRVVDSLYTKAKRIHWSAR